MPPTLGEHIELTLRRGYYNRPLRKVANLFVKVILCFQRHTVMFVQVYANPYICTWVNGLWIFRNGRSGVMLITLVQMSVAQFVWRVNSNVEMKELY